MRAPLWYAGHVATGKFLTAETAILVRNCNGVTSLALVFAVASLSLETIPKAFETFFCASGTFSAASEIFPHTLQIFPYEL